MVLADLIYKRRLQRAALLPWQLALLAVPGEDSDSDIFGIMSGRGHADGFLVLWVLPFKEDPRSIVYYESQPKAWAEYRYKAKLI